MSPKTHPLLLTCLLAVCLLFAGRVQAQEFDFDRLEVQINALQELFASADSSERPLIEARLDALHRQRFDEVLAFARRVPDDDESTRRLARQLLRDQNRRLRDEMEALNQQRLALFERSLVADADGQWEIEQEMQLLRGRHLEHLRMFINSVKEREELGEIGRSGRNYAEQQLRRQATLASGRVELANQERMQLAATPKPSGETGRARRDEQEQLIAGRLVRAAAALSQVADLMGELGLEAEEDEYRTLAISVDGRLSGQGSVGSAFAGLKHYLLTRAPGWVLNIILVAIILCVFWMLARGVGQVLGHWLARVQMHLSNLARDFLVGIAVKLVIFAGILIAASQLGIEIAPLLAGLGIAGFIIGFALQDSLSNFASGLMILICRPFDEGDFIDAAGVQGTVHRLNLMQTTIFTVENHRLTIPNNVIWGGIIRNLTSQKLRRIDLVFGVGYQDDVEQVERVLTEVLASHPKVVADPEPVVKLNALGDSAVEFIARPWVASADYLEVFWDLQKQVKLRFDTEGITIPHPQRALTIRHETKTPPPKPAGAAKPTGAAKPAGAAKAAKPAKPAKRSKK